MGNKIDLVELLKDCPSGMELDYALFEGTIFIGVEENKNYPILIKLIDGSRKRLTKYGCHSNADYAKCVIFPKGKTTWEGFHRPFRDGDILFVKSAFSWILIYKESENEDDLYRYVATPATNHTYIVYDDNSLCCKKDISEIRFATEEERQRLFDALKECDYKWNDETMTLEKLPKFKVGDRVKHISTYASGIVVKVSDKGYHIDYPKGEGVCYISFELEKDYELAPNKFDITTLIPFESKVLVRDNDYDSWKPSFWGYLRGGEIMYDTVRGVFRQCIPYGGNEHLCGTTNDCDDFYKTWEK